VCYFNREGRRTRARRSRLMTNERHHFQQHVMAVNRSGTSTLVDKTAEIDASWRLTFEVIPSALNARPVAAYVVFILPSSRRFLHALYLL
jgi:hypothetical protein